MFGITVGKGTKVLVLTVLLLFCLTQLALAASPTNVAVRAHFEPLGEVAYQEGIISVIFDEATELRISSVFWFMYVDGSLEGRGWAKTQIIDGKAYISEEAVQRIEELLN